MLKYNRKSNFTEESQTRFGDLNLQIKRLGNSGNVFVFFMCIRYFEGGKAVNRTGYIKTKF